jgi:hypothetical protein
MPIQSSAHVIAMVPRSLHRPLASTEGSLIKTSMKLPCGCGTNPSAVSRLGAPQNNLGHQFGATEDLFGEPNVRRFKPH